MKTIIILIVTLFLFSCEQERVYIESVCPECAACTEHCGYLHLENQWYAGMLYLTTAEKTYFKDTVGQGYFDLGQIMLFYLEEGGYRVELGNPGFGHMSHYVPVFRDSTVVIILE